MKTIVLLFCLSLSCSIATQAQFKEISYADGNQKLTGLGLLPKKTNADKSGILILPAWKGIDNHAKETAQQLADLGYYTFVADIYGEGNYPKNTKEAGERAGFYKKNIDKYQTRIRLALEQLINQGANPNKIVIIGFCFGGTGALEAARANFPVAGVVSFHGGLGKDSAREVKEIKNKILVCHGADDFYVPHDEVMAFQKEMHDAKADYQMISYANSVHAFTNPEAGNDNATGAAYNKKAAERSWQHFLLFLKEAF
ncbi:MAG: dienelactone hydrolase family protein [Flavobacterium sp.]|nr:dienelactone hydrolase family protein [Flavobacterium sp.]